MEMAIPTWRKMLGSSPDSGEPLNFLFKRMLIPGDSTRARRLREKWSQSRKEKLRRLTGAWAHLTCSGLRCWLNSSDTRKRSPTLRSQTGSSATQFLRTRNKWMPKRTRCLLRSNPSFPNRSRVRAKRRLQHQSSFSFSSHDTFSGTVTRFSQRITSSFVGAHVENTAAIGNWPCFSGL